MWRRCLDPRGECRRRDITRKTDKERKGHRMMLRGKSWNNTKKDSRYGSSERRMDNGCSIGVGFCTLRSELRTKPSLRCPCAHRMVYSMYLVPWDCTKKTVRVRCSCRMHRQIYASPCCSPVYCLFFRLDSRTRRLQYPFQQQKY